MDKYQEIYFERLFGNGIAYLYSTDLSKIYQVVKINNSAIELMQDEDITIQKYLLMFNNIDVVENVLIYYSNDKTNWQEIISKKYTRDKREFIAKGLNIDFSFPIKYIKIADKNNIIDPVILLVKYKEADKEKYYAKIEKAKKDELLKNAQIKHATGLDLVNIYFQPCCNEYARTTIVLYTKEQQLMAKYKVDEEVFFKSITGLAYGTYYYEVIQYDKDDKELLKTDKIKFVISTPHHSGKGFVIG